MGVFFCQEHCFIDPNTLDTQPMDLDELQFVGELQEQLASDAEVEVKQSGQKNKKDCKGHF